MKSWPRLLRWSGWQGPSGLAIVAGLFMVVAGTIFALAGYGPKPTSVSGLGSTSSSSAGSPSPAAPTPTPALTAMASPTPAATPTPTPTPTATPSVAPTALPPALPFADCSTSPGPGATFTEPLADNFRIVVGIPTGWTRQPVGVTETRLLLINAPRTYSHQPTTIEVLSLIGYFPNQSPRDIAPLFIPSTDLIGGISDCQVQGAPAAVMQYVQGDRSGYLVLFLHYNYLYGVRVEGLGGVDPRAIRDAKQVLGSIRWTVTTPPQR